MKLSYPVTGTYGFIFALSASWAWLTDVRHLHNPLEHMLPDVVLVFAVFPASLSLDPLYKALPNLLSKPLAQLTWLSLCGAAQATALGLIERRFRRVTKVRP
ncbi:hypothetical protein GT347_25460 [Xylophilus rhododendri]|uniref:Uncharacterized protein n=1 Tax=Xylophilus rhododendri TaxID=2697032 RepID=A0A857JBI2_9BURK|nr:hypothetical protein [Xylophilus rhododendri]QHJ01038.1 hypothetical protein GT347_25460 [Xylophilus rhododendri]